MEKLAPEQRDPWSVQRREKAVGGWAVCTAVHISEYYYYSPEVGMCAVAGRAWGERGRGRRGLGWTEGSGFGVQGAEFAS